MEGTEVSLMVGAPYFLGMETGSFIKHISFQWKQVLLKSLLLRKGRKEGRGTLMWEGCLFDIMAQGMGGYLEKSAYYSIDT